MTLPDPPPPGKRANRWWLFGPYIALLIAMIVWSGFWFWVKGRVEAELSAAKTQGRLGAAAITWDRAHVGGYPFRTEVVLDGVRVAEPSGWGVSTQQLRAETYAYDLKHWVAYLPHGAVLARPEGGPVTVTGEALHASLAMEGQGQDRFAFEGLNLTFATAPGAPPFPLASAHLLDVHTRPAGPPDEVEFLVQLQGASVPPSLPLGRIAGGQPISTAWHGTLSNASTLTGRDWPDAAEAWAAVGGSIVILGADLDAGPAHLTASGGQLSVGLDGRLRGGLNLSLARLPETLAALGKAGLIDPAMAQGAGEIAKARAAANPTAQADLAFQAGATTLGPLRIGPAPRLF
jgi:hypothetical protein